MFDFLPSFAEPNVVESFLASNGEDIYKLLKLRQRGQFEFEGNFLSIFLFLRFGAAVAAAEAERGEARRGGDLQTASEIKRHPDIDAAPSEFLSRERQEDSGLYVPFLRSRSPPLVASGSRLLHPPRCGSWRSSSRGRGNRGRPPFPLAPPRPAKSLEETSIMVYCCPQPPAGLQPASSQPARGPQFKRPIDHQSIPLLYFTSIESTRRITPT